jgi:hypothetical protein
VSRDTRHSSRRRTAKPRLSGKMPSLRACGYETAGLARLFPTHVAADVGRRHLRGGENAPTEVGGYSLWMNRARREISRLEVPQDFGALQLGQVGRHDLRDFGPHFGRQFIEQLVIDLAAGSQETGLHFLGPGQRVDPLG